MKYEEARKKCTQGEWTPNGKTKGAIGDAKVTCAIIAHEHNLFPKLLARLVKLADGLDEYGVDVSAMRKEIAEASEVGGIE